MKPRRHAGCRAIVLWAAAGTAVLSLSGCLVIPTDYYQAGSRCNVEAKTSEALHPGVSTMEDVVWALGEPDHVSDDGLVLGYAWTKVKAVWVAVGYNTVAGGEIPRSGELAVFFDESNRVSKVSLEKMWGPALDSQWTSQLKP
jgi:hypothetical protein